jgi:hypothetical protein
MHRINGRRFVTVASALIVGGYFGTLAVARSFWLPDSSFDGLVPILAVIVGAAIGAMLPTFIAWLVTRD